MNKKIKYGVRIVANEIRFKFKRIFSRGSFKSNGIQLVSLRAKLVSEKHGTIELLKLNQIEDGTLIDSVGGSVKLEGIFVNRNCNIVSMDSIHIMKNVTIGPNVCIYDHDHNTQKNINDSSDFVTAPIVIEENVWIGANVSILKGVTIGKNAVVAAGSSVTKNIPDNVVVGGVPAKIIKTR